MSLVLDSSVTLAWLFADETTEAIHEIFERVVMEGAWVPSLWRLEIANILTVGVRRKRITAEERDAQLHDLGDLVILTDAETGARAWDESVRLADRHRLTVYDAAYLELAMRRTLPLATLDEALRKAARDENIALLGM